MTSGRSLRATAAWQPQSSLASSRCQPSSCAHLSEAEKRAYILADNRLAEKAGWDREILAIELQALVTLDFEVELTGLRDCRGRPHSR